MDLDQLLSEAAPPARRTDETREALRDLVDASRTVARPRARRRVIAVGAVTIAALGGTAAATGSVPSSWIPWTTPDHHSCHMQFGVGPAGPDGLGGELNMMPKHIDPAYRAEEVGAARAFLAGFDYQSIDQQQALDEWNTVQAHIAASGGYPDPSTGDGRALGAVDYAVWTKLRAHLSALGYDMSPAKGSDLYLLIGTQTWNCDS